MSTPLPQRPDHVYRGRFAPSPTGPLHFGSLLAALASYCDARHVGGQWLVRIEDVDGAREVSGAAESILQTLYRYGFRWDAEAPRQSTRSARYRQILDTLINAGLVYPCACSRQRLQHAPLGASGERVYPGYCRPASGAIIPFESHETAAWRLRVPETPCRFTDLVQGEQCQNLSDECGDFILKRRDGFYAYHLAVVVDDIDQGITDIVRGADLLTLTPRHLWLYECLGHPPPSYSHIPVAATPEGQKLSKQTRAPALPENPLPTLLAAWRFLAQAQPPQSFSTPDAFWNWAITHWNPNAIPRVISLPAPL
ncbi:MAG: tRNA glutamyl-Q(34) synthetase GluQRS [Proteobacteria bacterium]|nr:tRNA glutamyl-Q(34) synthetase GluQRS [Pseudomonadota bacterium]MCL2308362.1 tRNA glutamyl-Q(34) synthetase GluQRS [Pseudomonadota bacterium]